MTPLRSLVLGLLMVGLVNAGAAVPAEQRIEFIIALQNSSEVLKLNGRGTVELRSVDGLQQHSLDFTENTSTTLSKDSQWFVKVAADDLWSPGSLLEVSTGKKRHEIPAWTLTTLTGRLKLEDQNLKLPKILAVTFGDSEALPLKKGAARIPSTTIECPVDPSGSFSCTVPKSNLDIRLRCHSFISHYLWNFNPGPGQSHELGILEIKQGASLVGVAESNAEAWNPAKATATLTSNIATGGADLLARQIGKATITRPLADNGFFHFEGIPPGTYVLEIAHPELATATVSPLDIFLDAETALKDPIELEEPIDLEIQLTPPLDWLDQPWTVSVSRASTHSASFDQRPLFWGDVPNGTLKLLDQSPGILDIRVADSKGNRLYSTSDFILEGTGKIQHTIDIDVFAISGDLRLGEEPLPQSILYFGGRFGSLRVRMETDEAGDFQGILPGGGTWYVDVENKKLDLLAKQKIEIDRKENVAIRLPDTEVFGFVVNSEGRRTPQTRVSLRAASSLPILSTTDDEGEFSFRGFDSGFSSLEAQRSVGQKTEFSNSTVVQVSETIPAGPIQLILEGSTRPLEGQVIAPRGPVAGGMIQLASVIPRGTANRTRTALDGSFSTMIDDRATLIEAIVLPPGSSLQSRVIQISEDQSSVIIELKDGQGDLEVVAPAETKPGEIIRLMQGNTVLPFQLMAQWAQSQGVPINVPNILRLPNVLPGFYKACTSSPESVSSAVERGETWREALQHCAEGYLEHGQTLRLEISAGGE